MSFTRPKKIVFCNNKGGVGKTTLLFNIAAEAVKQGNKVCMVDLDPQTNLTMNTIGEARQDDLFNGAIKNIYDVLKGLESGTSDIDTSVKPYFIGGSDNFALIPGSLNLAQFEGNILNTAMLETSRGAERGFRVVSAINRYLDSLSSAYDFDLFLIDTSPSLGVLNQTIILGSDFFVVPVNPNIYSVQGIENIGKTYTQWRSQWKDGPRVVGKSMPSELLLKSDPVFLGWILNDYTPYNEQPTKGQRSYISKIKTAIKECLSSQLTKNGLYEITQTTLGNVQQFGTLIQRTHEAATPVTMMTAQHIASLAPGSESTYQHVKKDIELVTTNIVNLAIKYQNV
jgi:chromosome partitioning protein